MKMSCSFAPLFPHRAVAGPHATEVPLRQRVQLDKALLLLRYVDRLRDLAELAAASDPGVNAKPQTAEVDGRLGVARHDARALQAADPVLACHAGLDPRNVVHARAHAQREPIFERALEKLFVDAAPTAE